MEMVNTKLERMVLLRERTRNKTEGGYLGHQL